ncbi:MAG: hypothetical protein QME78_16005 [Thermodesulfobacteriota bacterium]|nr:hypothetical protein [Thermodesulfobacteriota bacterium]
MANLSFIFLLLMLPFPSFAGEDPKARNLQGIYALQLIIERPTEDARDAGITEEAIRNQVMAIFQSRLPQVKLDAKEGSALYVRITLHKRKKEELYYGMINVSVEREVLVLSPSGNFPSFSQVWENTVVFSGRDPLPGTYALMAKLLNLLIEDWKKVNR